MGILKFLFKPKEQPKHGLSRLPNGTFTVDPNGRILCSTVPQCYPEGQLREIGHEVVALFKSAKDAKLRMSELVIHYASFQITARELRGGAIVFLAPKTLKSSKATY